MNIYEYTMLIHQLATIMQKIKQIQYLNDTLSLIKRNFTGTCIHCLIAINNYFLEFGLFILVVWVFVFLSEIRGSHLSSYFQSCFTFKISFKRSSPFLQSCTADSSLHPLVYRDPHNKPRCASPTPYHNYCTQVPPLIFKMC